MNVLDHPCLVAPTPLIDEERRLVISWSAKCACTHVVIWHFWHRGLLPASEYYHPGPHHFRQDVYYRSRGFHKAAARLDGEDLATWTLLKVGREPVRRCVSSFRHALRHGYENASLRAFLHREVDNQEGGFSFDEFVSYLAQSDLKTTNIHHQRQLHPIDQRPFGTRWLVNLDEDDLEQALATVEQRLGMPTFTAEGTNQIHRASRRHAVDVGADDPEACRRPLTKADADGSWPGTALAGDPELRQRIETMYAADVEMLEVLGRTSNWS